MRNFLTQLVNFVTASMILITLEAEFGIDHIEKVQHR